MGFYFSKSKFVSACTRCNKYAWLDNYKPEEKAPVDEFTQSLFDNGHKVGELAKEYFAADVDVTSVDESGYLMLSKMIEETEKHMRLGTRVIAEASFAYNGFFCSVDILVRNDDGTYSIYEVKSSKQDKPTKKNPSGVKEKYVIDAAYQHYVLTQYGIPVDKVYIVMLARDYVRGKTLELDKYFVTCDVSAKAQALQEFVSDKLAELSTVLSDTNEPATHFCGECNKCDYFGYCSRGITSPSPFDVYKLDFPLKCQYYNSGVSFFDIPSVNPDITDVAKRQIEYYSRPNDLYIDKAAVRAFLDRLVFPLYSLDFETYQAVVPEHEGMSTYAQIPFQYSLHIMKKANGDYSAGSPDIEERGFLDLSGGDPRRAIAESLVKNIPYGSCVVAYHHSTEKNIVGRLAEEFSDLASHLLSFEYRDPLEVFQNGHYYVKAMGKSMSLKSVSPALYPDDPGMDYHNLEGDVKNGTQAMNAILKLGSLSAEEIEKLRVDLERYCALDTLAVVKILKKLYEDAK